MPIYKLLNIGAVSLPDVWHVSPWLLIVLFAQASLLMFYMFEKHKL